MPRLTVKAIEAAKPRAGEYKLTVERALYLRVAPSGVKTWVVRYVVAGKQRQTRLPQPYGASGEGFMSLAKATAENARIQALAHDGIDFQEQRAEAMRETAAEAKRLVTLEKTVAELFESWITDGVARQDGNAELRRSFTKDVLPQVGAKLVKGLTEQDLRTVLRAMVKRGVGRMVVRVYNDLVQMFTWAEKRQPWRGLMMEGNPADLLDIRQILGPDFDLNSERERILSPAEILELHNIFVNTQAQYDSAANRRTAERPLRKEAQLALWICLGTVCRIGELLQARWQHIDLEAGTWFVPRQNTKTGVDWQVFLSEFALKQFKALHELTGKGENASEWCFPARLQAGHVCLKSVSKQIGDRQSRFKTRKPLVNRRHDDTLVLGNGQNGEWTPHDLRRTSATFMQALGVPLDVIDRCQNHVIAGSRVRRHYLHHDYAVEKREAWDKLGARISEILHPNGVGIA